MTRFWSMVTGYQAELIGETVKMATELAEKAGQAIYREDGEGFTAEGRRIFELQHDLQTNYTMIYAQRNKFNEAIENFLSKTERKALDNMIKAIKAWRGYQDDEEEQVAFNKLVDCALINGTVLANGLNSLQVANK